MNSINKPIYVVSTVSDKTYGTISYSGNKIVFHKHKAIEINKTKSSPKICTEIQISSKEISPIELDTYFRESNPIEISILEILEEKELLSKTKFVKKT